MSDKVKIIRNRKLRGAKTSEERTAATISVYEELMQGYVDGPGVLHKITPGGAAHLRYEQLIRNKVIEKQMRKKGYKKGTTAYKEVQRGLKEGGLL